MLGFHGFLFRTLTKEIIEEAIEAHIGDRRDAYWLQFYHFAINTNISVFDKLQME